MWIPLRGILIFINFFGCIYRADLEIAVVRYQIFEISFWAAAHASIFDAVWVFGVRECKLICHLWYSAISVNVTQRFNGILVDSQQTS
jgi:hypothetical protein